MRKLFGLFLVIALLTALCAGCIEDVPIQEAVPPIATLPPDYDYDYVVDDIVEDIGTPDIIIPFEGADDSRQYNELMVTFLDVGQADAALLECNGYAMLIDGGNRGDSDLLFSVLTHKGIQRLDYVIATHPHEDHIGGLAGALRAVSSVGTVYSPVTEYSTKVFENFVAAVEAHDVEITVPIEENPVRVISFMFGDASVTLIQAFAESEDVNDLSLVVRVVHGDNSFLFTGDLERDGEQEIVSDGFFPDSDEVVNLNATVLKVGHHGSNSSTTYPFLREIMPRYAVISVGRDNTYGHPHEDTLSRLRDANVQVFRTDMQGDIVMVSDGRVLDIAVSRNAGVQTNPTEQDGAYVSMDPPNTSRDPVNYVGNLNSKKYHLETCSSLPSENNRVYFTSDEMDDYDDYSPCGICTPNAVG